MKITKIKRTVPGVEVHYTEIREAQDGTQGTDTIIRKGDAEPLAAFDRALAALGPIAAGICELEGELEVHTVNFTDNAKGERGAILSCKRKLTIGPAMCFNTPLRHLSTGLVTDLGHDEASALDALEKEARKYIAGHCKQGSLPFPSESAGKADKPKKKKHLEIRPSNVPTETDIDQAHSIIMSQKRASSATLVRRMKITPETAVQILDKLTQRGILGPANAGKPREILADMAAG